MSTSPFHGTRNGEKHANQTTKEDLRKGIPGKIAAIKVLILKFKHVENPWAAELRALLLGLEEDYTALECDSGVKQHWEGGMSKTLDGLVALHNELVRKHGELIEELSKDNALDVLINQLDQRYDEFDSGK